MIDLNEWPGAMRLPLEKIPRQSDSLGFQKYRSNGHYCRLAEQTARG
jgi:hypothetical protein